MVHPLYTNSVPVQPNSAHPFSTERMQTWCILPFLWTSFYTNSVPMSAEFRLGPTHFRPKERRPDASFGTVSTWILFLCRRIPLIISTERLPTWCMLWTSFCMDSVSVSTEFRSECGQWIWNHPFGSVCTRDMHETYSWVRPNPVQNRCNLDGILT